MPSHRREERFLKTKRGTPEWLWEKWYKKLWMLYPNYATTGTLEPPHPIRQEFFRDILMVVEFEIAKFMPERSLILQKKLRSNSR